MNISSSTYTPVLHRLIRSDIDTMRAGFLLMALAVYAALGSPTPDAPGAVEIIIGILLTMAAGPGAVAAALRPGLSLAPWESVGRVLLVFGLSVPLIAGAARGNDFGLMARDIPAFLFMMLPLFFAALFEARRGVLLAGVLMVGAGFAARAALESYFPAAEPRELTYLANMPTVLFAALFFAGAGGDQFVKKFTPRSVVVLAACLALAALAILPVVMTAQRASLGYAALYLLSLGALAVFYYPYRAAALIGLLALAAIPLYPAVEGVAGALAQKSALVGFNMRFEELGAVWAEISKSLLTLIFGTGWGGTFESPAVGGVRVNFSHSLLSSALLKTGISGFILVFLYVFALLGRVFRGFRREPVLALALAGPVLIDVFFYASFKSLDFGLVLLLAALTGPSSRKVA